MGGSVDRLHMGWVTTQAGTGVERVLYGCQVMRVLFNGRYTLPKRLSQFSKRAEHNFYIRRVPAGSVPVTTFLLLTILNNIYSMILGIRIKQLMK